MTEHTEPVWIESDGVSNLPMVAGRYRVRCKGGASVTGFWYSYFNGDYFCGTTTEEEFAEHATMLKIQTGDFCNGNIDAWWDYQGLMSKPAQSIGSDHVHAGTVVKNCSVSGRISIECRAGNFRIEGNTFDSMDCTVKAVPRLVDGGFNRILNQISENIDSLNAVMPSDKPGIAAISAPKREPDGPTIIHGVMVDTVAFAAFLESQRPKPAPNNTPRGIMAVWNEAADHRLGMWRTVE